MRTIIDSNSPASVNRYLKLFDMANEALAEQGLTPVDPATGEPLIISTLEQYFTCIKDLWDMGRKEFVYLLPLDEDFFEIDVNSRTITVPRAFSKGVGVQSDVIAETLLFKIPRYVDAKDLNDVDNIWVQWEFGSSNNVIDEGYSKVSWRYINYDPNYLVFAWPLTGRVTKNYGTLKFAIRFEGKKSEDSAIYYSLNTLSASVIVNPALKAEMDYSEPYDSAESLFEKAVQNSQETSKPSDVAISAPTFRASDGARPLPAKAYLVNGALEVSAAAIVKDTGNLSYSWYLPEAADEASVIAETTYVVTKDLTRVNYKRYYTKSESNGITAFSLYSGEIAGGKGEGNVDVYEMVARLAIDVTSDGPIVGEYALDATNRQGWSSATASKNGETQLVEIPGPQLPVFEKDLPATGTFIAVPEEGEAEKVELDVDLILEDLTGILSQDGKQVDNPVIEYKWEKTVDNSNWYPVPSSNGNSISATVAELEEYLIEQGYEDIPADVYDLPGWYKMSVSSTLNRATTEPVASTICKVTRDPIQPVFEPVDSRTSVPSGTTISMDVKVANIAEFQNELKSDKLTYQWYGENHTLIEGASGQVGVIGEISYSTTFLGGTVSYQCEVTNELNGKSVSAVSGAFIWM